MNLVMKPEHTWLNTINGWTLQYVFYSVWRATGPNQAQNTSDKWACTEFPQARHHATDSDCHSSIFINSSLCLEFTRSWLPNTSVAGFKLKTRGRRRSCLCFITIKSTVGEEAEAGSPDAAGKHAKWNAKLLQEIVLSVVPRYGRYKLLACLCWRPAGALKTPTVTTVRVIFS